MNILDIIFIVIFGLAIVKGYKKGVVKTLLSVGGYILGMLVTFILFQPFQLLLDRVLNLNQLISPWVGETLSLPAATFQTRISDMALNQAVEVINQGELPEIMKKTMVDYVDQVAQLPVTKGIDTLGEGISYIVSSFILDALTFLILFTLATIFFRVIIPKIFHSASPKPLRQADKLGGAALGAVGGMISVALLIIVLIPVASLGGLKGNPSPLADQVNHSFCVNHAMTLAPELIDSVFSGGETI